MDTCPAFTRAPYCGKSEEVPQIGQLELREDEKCTPGEYLQANGKCQRCPVGHYSGEAEASECQPCAAGTMQPNEGQTECIACPNGWYQSEIGQQYCESCPGSRADSSRRKLQGGMLDKMKNFDWSKFGSVDGWEWIQNTTETIVNKTETAYDDAKNTVNSTLTSGADAVKQSAKKASDAVSDTFSKTKESAEDSKDTVDAAAADAKEKTDDAIDDAKKSAEKTTEDVKVAAKKTQESAEKTTEDSKETVDDAVNGVKKATVSAEEAAEDAAHDAKRLAAVISLASLTALAASSALALIWRDLAGVLLLAFVLGLRHALDADHIAAIDASTRHLLARGHGAPYSCGFWFSVGHTTVVFVFTAIAAALVCVTCSTASLI